MLNNFSLVIYVLTLALCYVNVLLLRKLQIINKKKLKNYEYK